MSPRRELEGERVAMIERMIVAPSVGVFRPLGVETGTTVTIGEIVGVVEGPGTREPVRSAFDGVVMGVLAHSGERMRVGQPVAWMRVA
jgi:biotin carboxyl carrier protein